MRLSFRNESPYARVVLVGIDQLLASTSNFMVVWLCLTSLPTEAFGSFSYSWSTIALFIVLSRSLFGIPALLDSESKGPVDVADTSASLTGAFVLGVFAAIVTLTLYLMGGASDNELWILGLFLLAPLILFQDQVRYLLIATKDIKFAIFLDVLVLTCVAGTVISAKNSEFVGWNLILGLAFGYIFTSLIFVFRTPIKMSIRNLLIFIRLDFHRRSRLVSDAFLAWGFGLIAITLIRVATGDFGIAIFNGLVFLFGPVAVVTVFLTLGLQAEVVRTKGNLAKRHKAWLALVCLTPVLWLMIFSLIPEIYVKGLLGQSMQVIIDNSMIFALSSVTFLLLEVLNLLMRTNKKFDELVKLRLMSGIIFTLLALLCGYLNLEIDAIIWSLTISNLLTVIATARVLRVFKLKDRSQIDLN